MSLLLRSHHHSWLLSVGTTTTAAATTRSSSSPVVVVQAAAFAVSGAVGRTITGVTLYTAATTTKVGKNNDPNRNNNNNPFSSMMSHMAASILGGGGRNKITPPPNFEAQIESLNVPSWYDIRSRLEQQQTPEERLFRTNLPNGYGVGSPLHQVRLHHEQNRMDDIRVVFYRDTASWCPYCQKVWIALEEKQIPYRVEKINMRCYGEKPLSFQQLQPSGQIPVAIIDGVTYRQSNEILSVLEESFPNHKSLTPHNNNNNNNDENERTVSALLRLERELFSAWMYWLTSSPNGRDAFLSVLQRVEEALSSSKGPFFVGHDISIVDVQFAPFLERIVASLLYYKGLPIRVVPGTTTTTYPAINAWFDAMEGLPSYRLTKGDYYSHCWDLPPQLGGCLMEPDGQPFAARINGETHQHSWELPLVAHNGGIEPDWSWIEAGAARREVVERVSYNPAALTRFAARGAGRPGYPSVAAPLSDPRAIPNESVVPAVDVLFRLICLSLLDDGTTTTTTTSTAVQHTTMESVRQMIQHSDDDAYRTGLVDSLAYVRDRVGVPRDMSLGAARQLRAHLNGAIRSMTEAPERRAAA